MHKAKIASSLDEQPLDRLVHQRIYLSRSCTIRETVEEKLQRFGGSRLARECGKLDPEFEQAMADEGIAGDLSEWPEY